ncbi:uroporphyrinogen-III C-methyltransferase [Longispora fulva]|uniref:Uroporphyrin-III C-methyltransferase/precorrin-2 dehydrogenase/sirohydrochlorin ferrochelatase n=1 Tax=Longispora fulva TaxID=619741 RepID=A0A8J7KMN7_9ACTN|nr:uroporphyrinogen-III C-methyltransferase [Longispora fulva]MBG6140719.1 uroporphyrin-III C-methyltransferase/precorrin-2 dehydrogenase/sirohydrochlorin ferrochelatase [Longispora fulva]
MTVYPLGLILTGRNVLVVGGGHVAQRRVPALLEAGAVVTVVSPSLTPALEALPVTWVKRGFEPSDLDGQWFVHVATQRPEVNAAVSAAAEERRVFCVRADDRTQATAWTPAVTRHGPVTVAVLSGGDPRRSMALRDAIHAGLESDTLEPAAHGDKPRGVALVGAGPGDPELITVKGRRLLAQADVVVADRLASGLFLEGLRPEVELIDAAKVPYGRQLKQEAINEILVDRALEGKFVVRLKGGDPYIFGRGGEELIACAEAGVPVTVVPGVTSAISVPALAGIPVTHRGVTHEFTVVSGHIPPAHPDSLIDWAALGRMRGTLVLLMAVENLAAIAAELISHGRDPQTPTAVIQEGTTVREQVFRGTLATAATLGAQPPAIVVIGEVVNILNQDH